MYKSLGNGLLSTGNRLFKSYREGERTRIKLVSWRDKKCGRCGRFLKKMNKNKKCSECNKESNKEYDLRYAKEYYRKMKIILN